MQDQDQVNSGNKTSFVRVKKPDMMKAPLMPLLLLLPVSLMSAEEQCHDWTPTDQVL